MSRLSLSRLIKVVVALVIAAFLWPAITAAGPAPAAPGQSVSCPNDDGDDSRPKKKKKKKRKKKKSKKKIHWGQKRDESDEKYVKRYNRLFKRVRQTRKGDYRGGAFANKAGEEVQLWTYMGHPGCPFIIRTDISQEFTAQLAMYMENLHREYSTVYHKLLGFPAQVKEKVEIITFADPGTYFRAGGMPGSGGQFSFAAQFYNDRGMSWPARHYRMMQFTDGVTEFGKWPKGVLKHESSHMELYMRVGYKQDPRTKQGYPIIPPIWWNEGQAGVFEDWDFDKTVDENFADLGARGRYPPLIRRMYDTDTWRDFDYYWTINRGKWGGEGRTLLNYAEGWTLVAYMFTGGPEGRADFRRIFDLTKRVGGNEMDISFADRKIGWSRAWEEKFPPEMQKKMRENWRAWVERNVPRDGRVPDEEFILRRWGIDPTVTKGLEFFKTPEEVKENKKWVEKEERRRKKATIVHR
jgi:hypothetical protein